MLSSPFPPTPTVLLYSLPPSILLGIDLQTLTTTSTFHGIKNLPPGPHFLFAAETPSHSLRSGLWFFIPNPTTTSGSSSSSSLPSSQPLQIFLWDLNSASLIPCSATAEPSHRARLPALWEKNLMPYKQPNSPDADWPLLTHYITPFLLSRLLGPQHDGWAISTSSSAPEDTDHIPGLDMPHANGPDRPLQTLGIDLKRTWRPGAIGRERTEGATDRSWALQDLARRLETERREADVEAEVNTNTTADTQKEVAATFPLLLGALQLSFLHALLLANHSSQQEWQRILRLTLTSSRAVPAHPAYFASCLRLLLAQLRAADACSEDADDGGGGGEGGGGLFELEGELQALVNGFRRILADVDVDVDVDVDGAEVEPKSEKTLPPPPPPSSAAAKITPVKTALRLLTTHLRLGDDDTGDSFVRRGTLQLEDGEEVEMEVAELEGEDERGEYAPMMVEL